MRIVALLFVLLFASPACAQVTFDAVASAPTSAATATSISNANLTVGANPNRAVVILLSFSAVSQTCPPASLSVTGSSGSTPALINSATAQSAGNDCAVLYGATGVSSGTYTASASWTGSRDAVINVVSVFNANQTGGATTFPSASANDGGTTSTTPSVTISSAASHYTVADFASGTSFSSVSGTAVTMNAGGAGLSFITTQGSRTTGAASVTASATLAGADHWGAVVTDIVPASGAAAANCTMTTMGAGSC